MAFLYASYANMMLTNNALRRVLCSPTYCGGAIAYKSRTQSITTISSTKAEFLVVVLFAKIALFLCSILEEKDSPNASDGREIMCISNG